MVRCLDAVMTFAAWPMDNAHPERRALGAATFALVVSHLKGDHDQEPLPLSDSAPTGARRSYMLACCLTDTAAIQSSNWTPIRPASRTAGAMDSLRPHVTGDGHQLWWAAAGQRTISMAGHMPHATSARWRGD